MSQNHRYMFIAAIAAALPFVTFGAEAVAQQNGGTVRLQVSAFRNTKGTLNCRLFSQPASFADGDGVRTVQATISGAEASCAFNNVAPGTYAVAVVHDENANGRLDKNFLGIPTEGYGVSNNHTYALSAPKWDESNFVLTANEPVNMRVSLRY